MTPEQVQGLYSAAEMESAAMVRRLKKLVTNESPSGDHAGLTAMAATLTQRWTSLGAQVTEHADEVAGVHLEVRFPGPSGTPDGTAPALIVGHLDTVHPRGALDRNPLRQVDGLLWGPGTQDMKGGLVIAEQAVKLLAERAQPLLRPVVVLITADEEVGSIGSRALIEQLARESAYALVLEGAAPGGSLKTARKGVGLYTVGVTGKAAHAGAHFDEGINAAVGLAELIPAIARLTDLERGTTVNVGVLAAGTVVNVVPERAVARIDMRFVEDAEAARVEAALQALHPRIGTLQVTGGVNRPAMRRTQQIGALFTSARDLVAPFETLTETAVGGASDGNFTAAAGTPTLDGLGPVGAGLHTDDEYVVIDSLHRRAGLVASLLATL